MVREAYRSATKRKHVSKNRNDYHTYSECLFENYGKEPRAEPREETRVAPKLENTFPPLLLNAVHHRDREVVKMLMGREDIQVNKRMPESRDTPLIRAARNGDKEMVSATCYQSCVPVYLGSIVQGWDGGCDMG